MSQDIYIQNVIKNIKIKGITKRIKETCRNKRKIYITCNNTINLQRRLL